MNGARLLRLLLLSTAGSMALSGCATIKSVTLVSDLPKDSLVLATDLRTYDREKDHCLIDTVRNKEFPIGKKLNRPTESGKPLSYGDFELDPKAADTADSAEDFGYVVCATKEVPIGTIISKEYLTSVPIHRESIGKGCIDSINQAIGKNARTTIPAGSAIFHSDVEGAMAKDLRGRRSSRAVVMLVHEVQEGKMFTREDLCEKEFDSQAPTGSIPASRLAEGFICRSGASQGQIISDDNLLEVQKALVDD